MFDRACRIIGIALAALIVFALFSQHHRTSPPIASAGPIAPTVLSPEYKWQDFRKNSFVLGAGSVWHIGPLPISKLKNGEKVTLRNHVTTTVPVVSGYMPAAWLDQLDKDPSILAVPENFNHLRCRGSGVLDDTQTCTFVSGDDDVYFVIYDPRSIDGTKVIASMGLAWLGAKQPLSDMTATNTVTLKTDVWACQKNCTDADLTYNDAP